LEAQNNVGANQCSIFLWSQQKSTEKKFQFGDYVLWFPKGEKTHLGKLKKDILFHLRYIIAYLIIFLFLFLLTTLNQTQYWYVATLTLGLQPRQGLARVWAKKEAQESHLMLLGM
jgi:hypothetical protein